MKVAFYKGSGDWTDKAIRLWTHSKYSHSELIINGIWYSSSPRDGRVRAKKIIPKVENWDFISISASKSQELIMLDFLNQQIGKPYDWTGILFSQIFPLGVQDPKRWFCSEICSSALLLAGIIVSDKAPQWFSPARLYKKLKEVQ